MPGCPTCGREFESNVGLGVHQKRTPACYDPEAQRLRARAREKRWNERHPLKRRRLQREAMARLREEGYFARWRAEHPGAEAARLRRWKRANPDKVAAQRQRARERARVDTSPLPPSHTGHEAFEAAWAVLGGLGVRRDSHLREFHDTFWEEVASAVVVAIVAGEDPEEAGRRAVREENRWRALTAPLLEWAW